MSETHATRVASYVKGASITAFVAYASLIPPGIPRRSSETEGFEVSPNSRSARLAVQYPGASTHADSAFGWNEPAVIDATGEEEQQQEGLPSSLVIPSSASKAGSSRANIERIELLARKYVEKHLSLEEAARLAIVSERTRRLFPSVTEQEIATVKEIATGLDVMRDQLSQIREEFQLDA